MDDAVLRQEEKEYQEWSSRAEFNLAGGDDFQTWRMKRYVDGKINQATLGIAFGIIAACLVIYFI